MKTKKAEKENKTPVRDQAHKRRSLTLFSPNSRSDKNVNKTPGASADVPGETNSANRRHFAPALVEMENDDAEELRSRQLLRAQQNVTTPTSATRKTGTNPLSGMSNTAIAEQYANCIKLSTENKINMKNAFSLPLIDCMTEMIQKNNPEMNNFQAASCTLDASTKIYAYRVDVIHVDTLKIAGGLGRSAENAETRPSEENAEAGINGELSTKQKTKKRKASKTIETNLNNINLPKSSMNFEVDPYFKKASALFDEGRSGGVHFLSSVHFVDDSCELNMDRDRPWRSTSYVDSACDERLDFDFDFPDIRNTEICPSFKNFSFRKWSVNDPDIFGSADTSHSRTRSQPNEPFVPFDEDYAFDANAVPDSSPVDDNDDDDMRYGGVDDIEDCDGGGAVTFNLDPVPTVRSGTGGDLDITQLKEQLSLVPCDYSYFRQTTKCAWAGPMHWRFPAFKRGESVSGAVEGSGKQTRRRVKESVDLDFSKPVDHKTAFRKAPRTSKLTSGSVEKWSHEKITLPTDARLEIDLFTKLKLHPLIVIGRVAQPDSSQEGSSGQGNQGLPPQLDFDEAGDQGLTGDVPADNDSDDDRPPMGFTTFGVGFDDVTEMPSQMMDCTRAFAGENLVEAPNMVSKVQINYARVAKKMDMNRLKSTIRHLITQPEPTTVENSPQSEDAPQKKISFSALYNELPKKLPAKMTQNLSVSLAFIGLLHVANERNLTLSQKPGDLSDFEICL